MPSACCAGIARKSPTTTANRGEDPPVSCLPAPASCRQWPPDLRRQESHEVWWCSTGLLLDLGASASALDLEQLVPLPVCLPPRLALDLDPAVGLARDVWRRSTLADDAFKPAFFASNQETLGVVEGLGKPNWIADLHISSAHSLSPATASYASCCDA